MDNQVNDQVQSETVAVSTPNRLDLRRVRVVAVALLSVLLVSVTRAAHAASGSPADVTQSVNNFLGTITGIVRLATPFVALIAFAGLGIMYMGASIPMIADWKKDNPKAANSVVLGLVFVLVATAAAAMLTGALG